MTGTNGRGRMSHFLVVYSKELIQSFTCFHEEICWNAALFSQGRYSALSNSTQLLDSGQNKTLFFLSFMGIAFALWVSFNMSIWYIAVTFWCFSDYTVMIACLVFVTISPPSRCCIVICQTDNAVQLVFVHCATRVVFISGHRENMFQEWFGCWHRWAIWQN